MGRVGWRNFSMAWAIISLAGFEYVHIDYGKVTYDIPGSPNVDSNVDVVKVGLDYIF